MDRNFRLEAERSGRHVRGGRRDAFVSRAALGRMVTEDRGRRGRAGDARDARTLWRRHRPVGGNGGVMSVLDALRARALERREAARCAAADAGRGAGRDGRGERLRLRADRLRARAGRPDPAPTAHRRRPAARRRRAGPDRCRTSRRWPCGSSTRVPSASSPRTWTTRTPRVALVDSVHYPPLGHRGFATYSRAGRFGLVDAAAHRERYAGRDAGVRDDRVAGRRRRGRRRRSVCPARRDHDRHRRPGRLPHRDRSPDRPTWSPRCTPCWPRGPAPADGHRDRARTAPPAAFCRRRRPGRLQPGPHADGSPGRSARRPARERPSMSGMDAA